MKRGPSRGTIARRRAGAAVLLALGVAVVFSVVRGGGGEPAPTVTRASKAHHGAPSGARRSVGAALERGVREAGRLGGSVQAAVMLGPWSAPVLASTPRRQAWRPARMWSMSKVLTFVALLRASGWGAEPGEPLAPEVGEALRAAIARSENCPQRRVVLQLQQLAGGSPAGARLAMSEVLQVAGARADLGAESAPPDASCVAYLESQREIEDPLGEALLAGTSTWTVDAAARFTHALATGVYGRAVTRRVLDLMRLPKERSGAVLPSEYTPASDWGAGRALGGMEAAYKPGWGGALHGEFMAGQIVVIDRPGGGRAALVVMFHPDTQPPIDDPGRTAAPRGLELVMESVVEAL